MRIQFQDHIWPFESKLSVAEAMLLHDKSKIGLNEFLPELIKGNPYVAATLVFILARRNKVVIQWDQLLGENAFDIKLLPDEEPASEEGAEAADVTQDPPVRSSSGKTRRRATSNT